MPQDLPDEIALALVQLPSRTAQVATAKVPPGRSSRIASAKKAGRSGRCIRLSSAQTTSKDASGYPLASASRWWKRARSAMPAARAFSLALAACRALSVTPQPCSP